jgi:hypothetical protein
MLSVIMLKVITLSVMALYGGIGITKIRPHIVSTDYFYHRFLLFSFFGASVGSWTRTLNLGMMRLVYYPMATILLANSKLLS